jgi:hypothetical protein
MSAPNALLSLHLAMFASYHRAAASSVSTACFVQRHLRAAVIDSHAPPSHSTIEERSLHKRKALTISHHTIDHPYELPAPEEEPEENMSIEQEEEQTIRERAEYATIDFLESLDDPPNDGGDLEEIIGRGVLVTQQVIVTFKPGGGWYEVDSGQTIELFND